MSLPASCRLGVRRFHTRIFVAGAYPLNQRKCNWPVALRDAGAVSLHPHVNEAGGKGE